MLLVTCFMVAMLISVVMVPGLIRLAVPFGLVDEPNERKVHTVSIPRVGGIAISFGALIPIFVWADLTQELVAYLLGSLIIVVFGIWDDRKELGYKTKLFGQILAISVFIYWGQLYIQWLPFQGLSIAPLWLSILLTYFSLLGITNAVNLTDGLDGLAGGTSLISLTGICLLAFASGSESLVVLCLAVCGSIFGFLRYNTHPARIFMGDTGSQFLGFTVGVAAVLLTQQANTALSPVLPLILLGLPILDTLTVMTRRIMQKRSPFSPDKNHFHHRLMDMNFKHYEAVIIIYLVQIALIAIAFVMRYQPDLVLLLVFLTFCFGFNGVFRLAESNGWQYQGNWFRKMAGQINASLERRKTTRVTVKMLGPFLQLSLPLYLFVCFWVGKNVEGVVPVLTAMCVFSIALLTQKHTELTLWLRRVLWYAACGLAVYCSAQVDFHLNVYAKLYTGVLVISVLLAFYLGRREDFKINPLDVIVLLGAAILFYTGKEGGIFAGIGYHFAQVMLLLYAVELALEKHRFKALEKWPLVLVFLCCQVFVLI
jgi:UDP-GlcNAc:undecaprenyl-phosphate/decaprenyl-phosphate GlcNAc-1-phosphate transferase